MAEIFHRFSDLPQEIKDLIWEFALANAHRNHVDRRVYVDMPWRGFGFGRDPMGYLNPGLGVMLHPNFHMGPAPRDILLSCREAKKCFDLILTRQVVRFPETNILAQHLPAISLELNTFAFNLVDITFPETYPYEWPAFMQEIRHVQVEAFSFLSYVLGLTWDIATRSPNVTGKSWRRLTLGPFGGPESKLETFEIFPDDWSYLPLNLKLQELESLVMESDSEPDANFALSHLYVPGTPWYEEMFIKKIRIQKHRLQERLAEMRRNEFPVWTTDEKIAWWHHLRVVWVEANSHNYVELFEWPSLL